jgi:hypothetical protein
MEVKMSQVSSATRAAPAAAPAKPETFEHNGVKFPVKSGIVQDTRSYLNPVAYVTTNKTREEAQKAYDASKQKAPESTPLYKLPFVLVKTIVSTVWNTLLNLITWCFPKGEKVEGNKDGQKAATTAQKAAK